MFSRNSLEVILVIDIILNTQSQFSFNLNKNVIFFSFEKMVVTLLNSYLIRIVSVGTVNVPTESQIRNITLSHNCSTYM